jgi:stage V sporulation protein AC
MTNPNSATDKQKIDEQNYQILQENNRPPDHLAKNCFNAFWTGGLICLLAQVVQEFLLTRGFTTETVGAPTSAILILCSVILTSLGWYDRISQLAGAGTAVPITGFANTMSSAALEYRSEGFVLGVGGNMFKVAGPVIVFGAVSAFIVSIICALFQTMGGGAL